MTQVRRVNNGFTILEVKTASGKVFKTSNGEVVETTSKISIYT